MPALPEGTVTFVFTDIEGSTTILKQLGERYREVLAQHRQIVRDAFGAAGGSEIDTQGDAFFYAFPRARAAVASAVEVQRAHAEADWPDAACVRVRIGVHTGEPHVGDEGYLGLDVVRAARICAVARGGNVLISQVTRALIGSNLPEGVSVFPVGERHLKDIDEPERVYELEIEGVETTPAPKPEPEPEPEPQPTAAPAPPSTPPPGPRDGKKKKKQWGPGDDFGERLSERIQARVLRTVERRLDKAGLRPPSGDDEDLDDIAARAGTFEERIRNLVESSLRAKGLPPE
jgi:class 3 adenylate cyclase